MEKENEVFEGDLIIRAGESAEYGYTKITGSVVARENAKLSLPVCTSVGGYVDARENAKLSLPVHLPSRGTTLIMRIIMIIVL